MNTNTDLFTFVHNIANTITTEKALPILCIGFNLDYDDLAEEMKLITKQAYSGLDNDCGDWCKSVAVKAYLLTL
jgi:hypothetical protein